MKPKPHGRPHVFTVDPEVPPDHLGHHACRCGLVGQPGDAHHTMPPAPERDVRGLAAGDHTTEGD